MVVESYCSTLWRSHMEGRPADLQSGEIPHGREEAVRELIRRTRERFFAGMPLPVFGAEPADFLSALRREASR
jgi:hypothetical protein